MTITLRQLLPQVSGTVRVKQPYTYATPDATMFECGENMLRYFTNEELDRNIDTVTVYEGYSTPMLLIIMNEVERP